MKTKWLYIVAAVALVVSISAVKPALAYFTATKTVEGTTKELKIGDTPPELDETVEGMTKKITISNTGDYDIFVRVKAITPDNWKIQFHEADGWEEQADGYYYYTKPLAPTEATAEQLILEILPKEVSEEYGVLKDIYSQDSFNVVIIQEATKVYYNRAGEPVPDDWSDAVKNRIDVER